jgi:hypothetical protein
MTRGRRPNIEPSVATNLHLPESIRTQIDLILYSTLEQRVPKGAYQRFFLERLQEFFSTQALDLSAPLGLPPGQGIIKCRPEARTALLAHFSQGTS